MDERAVPLRMTYDGAAKAAYIYLQGSIEPGGIARTVPVHGSTINVDFDQHGRVVGLEILDATATLPASLYDAIRGR